ncbi:hypothetical protein [Actinacidiphila glaucinigra]|uniref:hypothetical protein n=1 Tax=Actinacidiphila glaucinigra TaxID=235986 RepID=UPI003671C3FB
MPRYVTVPEDGIPKYITNGPWDTDDPSTIIVAPGNVLMLEEEAFAAGFQWSPGAGVGFAPDPDQDDDHHGRGHDQHGQGHGHGHDHHQDDK